LVVLQLGSKEYLKIKIKEEFLFAINEGLSLNLFLDSSKKSKNKFITYGYSKNINIHFDHMIFSSFDNNYKLFLKKFELIFPHYSKYYSLKDNLESFLKIESNAMTNLKSYGLFFASGVWLTYITMNSAIYYCRTFRFTGYSFGVHSIVENLEFFPPINRLVAYVVNLDNCNLKYSNHSLNSDYARFIFIFQNLVFKSILPFSFRKFIKSKDYRNLVFDLQRFNVPDFLIFSSTSELECVDLNKKLVNLDFSLFGLNLLLLANNKPLISLCAIEKLIFISWGMWVNNFKFNTLPPPHFYYIQNPFRTFFYTILIYVFTNIGNNKIKTNLVSKCFD
jgi:hypothetical protein